MPMAVVLSLTVAVKETALARIAGTLRALVWLETPPALPGLLVLAVGAVTTGGVSTEAEVGLATADTVATAPGSVGVDWALVDAFVAVGTTSVPVGVGLSTAFAIEC